MQNFGWWVVAPVIAAVVGGLLALARELRGWGRQRPPSWKPPLAHPINAAHRGGDVLFPENTLEAFRAASELGCRFMELDVHASADGVPVVIHDPTVERTTGGSGAVNGLSLAELKKLDAGFRFRGPDGRRWAGQGVRIPTLEQTLRDLPDCVFSIDIKQSDPPCEAAVVEVLRRADAAGRVVAGSEIRAVFSRLQALAPEIPSFFTFRSVFAFFMALWLGLARWYRPPHSALMIPPSWWGIPLVTARSVRAARRLRLPLIVWTINEEDRMRDLLRLGVDGIVTGRPDLLARVIGEQVAEGPKA